MNYLKLLIYTAILYLIRLYVIGWIEMAMFFEAMHQPMETYADCFGFTAADMPFSHLYNYLLWLSVLILFHTTHPALPGKMIWKSLLIFGIACLFFISLTGIFMNHFNEGIRVFFKYAMQDALLLFTSLGIINGLLYPLVLK